MDDGIGYYKKELDDGRIELFIGIGDGVLMSEGIFDSLDDIERYIETIGIGPVGRIEFGL